MYLIFFIGDSAVCIFFLISGYLITQSWLHKEKVKRFLIKRLLRILPGLAVVICVTVIIIGPLNTSFSLVQYFSTPDTFTYFKNIFLYPLQFSLPGVFLTNAYPTLVNHSFWTLPLEFTAYILIMIFGLLRILNITIFMIIFVFILILFDTFFQTSLWYTNFYLYDMPLHLIITNFIFFFIGSLFYLLHVKIKYKYSIFIFMIALFPLILSNPQIHWLEYIAFSYIIMSVAFLLPPKLSFIQKFGDPSYGMYLFSMPLQQKLIHFKPTIASSVLFGLTFIMVLLLGYLSWHIIEYPLLRLKNYFV